MSHMPWLFLACATSDELFCIRSSCLWQLIDDRALLLNRLLRAQAVNAESVACCLPLAGRRALKQHTVSLSTETRASGPAAKQTISNLRV